MIQDTPINFRKVPRELIPDLVQELIGLFGHEDAGRIYHALPKGREIYFDRSKSSELYCHLVGRIGRELTDRLFEAYGQSRAHFTFCHNIRLWARNEVIRLKARALWAEGKSSRLAAYMLGWEFGLTSKQVHAINNMYTHREAGPTVTAMTCVPQDEPWLSTIAKEGRVSVRIDLATAPRELIPGTAWPLIDRLGFEDASTVVSKIGGFNEGISSGVRASRSECISLLRARLGDGLADRLIDAFRGEKLLVPRCHQIVLWMMEQDIRQAMQVEGVAINNHFIHVMAMRHGRTMKTIAGIVRKKVESRQVIVTR